MGEKNEDVDVLERTGSLGAEPLMRVLMKAVPESLPNSPGGSWEVKSWFQESMGMLSVPNQSPAHIKRAVAI